MTTNEKIYLHARIKEILDGKYCVEVSTESGVPFKAMDIATRADWSSLVEIINGKDVSVMCSSGLDWPGDYMLDETFIKITNLFTGNTITLADEVERMSEIGIVE